MSNKIATILLFFVISIVALVMANVFAVMTGDLFIPNILEDNSTNTTDPNDISDILQTHEPDSQSQSTSESYQGNTYTENTQTQDQDQKDYQDDSSNQDHNNENNMSNT